MHQVGHAGATRGGPQSREHLGLGLALRRNTPVGEHGHLYEPEAGRAHVLNQLDRPLLAQLQEARRGVAAEAMREGGDAQGPVAQGGQNRIVRGDRRSDEAHHGSARAEARGGQQQLQALARGRQVVLGHPFGQVNEGRLDERRVVDDLEYVLQLDPRGRLGLAQRHPDGPPLPERHHHADTAGYLGGSRR